VEAQRLAAGDEHREARGRGEKPGDERRGLEDVLEVVEHEEHVASGERCRHQLVGALRATLAQPERLGHRRRDEVGGRHGREADHVRTVDVPPGAASGQLQREPRLPGAAGAGEREQPRLAEQRGGEGELPLAADQRGERRLGRGGAARGRAGAASARSTSAADCGRAAGSRASSERTSRSSAAGTCASGSGSDGEDGVHHRRVRPAAERAAAGEHLVRRHAERPEVRAVVDAAAAELLGAR
jgi:hypothetical protein